MTKDELNRHSIARAQQASDSTYRTQDTLPPVRPPQCFSFLFPISADARQAGK